MLPGILLFILLLIFIVFFAIISAGSKLLGGILRFFLGSPKSTRQKYQSYNKDFNSGSSNQHHSHPQGHKKIFSKEEGEYVDFEEITD